MASTLNCIPSDIAALTVLDQNAVSHTFSKLYNHDAEQTLFIFIRHFFCGSCKEYISALSQLDSGISVDGLSASKQRLIIIGCGEPTLIDSYKKATHCSFQMYADPTQQLYDALGMIRTLKLGDRKPDYIKTSLLVNVAKSAFCQLTAGSTMFQGGDIHQVGGEFLIDQRGNILWSNKMQNTRDHTEIQDLHRILTRFSPSIKNP